MKHIKKFKLFESKAHPGDYLKDGEIYKKLDWSFHDALADDENNYLSNYKASKREIIKIKEITKNLYNKFDTDLTFFQIKFNSSINTYGIPCIYYAEILKHEVNELVYLYISKIDDDYYIVDIEVMLEYDIDNDTYDEYNSDRICYLCDGLNGIKKWAEEYII
jgi:hypothetical protein